MAAKLRSPDLQFHVPSSSAAATPAFVVQAFLALSGEFKQRIMSSNSYRENLSRSRLSFPMPLHSRWAASRHRFMKGGAFYDAFVITLTKEWRWADVTRAIRAAVRTTPLNFS
jgi:hypothetical protein